MLRVVFASVVVVTLVAVPPVFAADTRVQILRECQDGRLTGDYTASQIRDARNHIPTDIDQYSDCRDVLSRALANLAGGGGSNGGGGSTGGGAGGGGIGGSGSGGSGSGGSDAGGALLTPTTPADHKALDDAARSGGAPVRIGEESVVPGATGLAAGAARHSLPVLLIVLLALIAAAAVAALAPGARRRVAAFHPADLAQLGRRVLRRGS
jgi:hypothetical protein